MSDIDNERILEENRKLHNFSANNFDNYPPNIMRELKDMLFVDVSCMQVMLCPKLIRTFRALDCGAGTGILGEILVNKNFDTYLMDISKEMIEICKKKTDNKAKYIVSDAQSLLAHTPKKFDVICFTSVLHHIKDYIGVLELAIDRLNPGGFIYIADEPQLVTKEKPMSCKMIEWFEGNIINTYRLCKNPKHALNFLSKKDADFDVSIAEFHAAKGIDEKKIQDLFDKKGFKTIGFSTYRFHSLKMLQWFDWFYKNQPKTFKMMARKK